MLICFDADADFRRCFSSFSLPCCFLDIDVIYATDMLPCFIFMPFDICHYVIFYAALLIDAWCRFLSFHFSILPRHYFAAIDADFRCHADADIFFSFDYYFSSISCYIIMLSLRRCHFRHTFRWRRHAFLSHCFAFRHFLSSFDFRR